MEKTKLEQIMKKYNIELMGENLRVEPKPNSEDLEFLQNNKQEIIQILKAKKDKKEKEEKRQEEMKRKEEEGQTTIRLSFSGQVMTRLEKPFPKM